MRHPLRCTLALAAVLITCAQPVDAQGRKIFVGAGAIVDNDQTNSRLTDPAGSWTFVVGAEVQPHLGIRMTVDAPRETSSAVEGVYATSEFPFPIRQRLTRSRRSMTFAVLADVHGNVAPRLRIAATCGLANVTHDTETIATRERIKCRWLTGPDGGLPGPERFRLGRSCLRYRGRSVGYAPPGIGTGRARHLLCVLRFARTLYLSRRHRAPVVVLTHVAVPPLAPLGEPR